MIETYLEAKRKMAKYKALEAQLRLELLTEVFNDSVIDGTETDFIGKFKVKGSFKLGFKLDAVALAKEYENLTTWEQNCIIYKPSLSVAKFKELDEDQRLLLDDLVTVSPSMPTVVITEEEDDE